MYGEILVKVYFNDDEMGVMNEELASRGVTPFSKKDILESLTVTSSTVCDQICLEPDSRVMPICWDLTSGPFTLLGGGVAKSRLVLEEGDDGFMEVTDE